MTAPRRTDTGCLIEGALVKCLDCPLPDCRLSKTWWPQAKVGKIGGSGQIPTAVRERIAQQYKEGLSVRQIASQWHISARSVHNIKSEYGLRRLRVADVMTKTRQRFLACQERKTAIDSAHQRIAQLYRDGMPVAEIQKKCHITPGGIYIALRNCRVSLRSRGRIQWGTCLFSDRPQCCGNIVNDTEHDCAAWSWGLVMCFLRNYGQRHLKRDGQLRIADAFNDLLANMADQRYVADMNDEKDMETQYYWANHRTERWGNHC